MSTGPDFENHQPYLESTTIEAWIDVRGAAHGTIVWMDVFNGLYDQQGRGISGSTWQVEVDTFQLVSDHEAYVEGTVTHSQVPGDVGARAGFFVADRGRGASGPPDELNVNPLLAGGVTVR